MTIPRPEDRLVINLLDDSPARSAHEIFTEILVRENVPIERIVSTGQSTPADQPHRQRHDEWVLLLAGLAGHTLRLSSLPMLMHLRAWRSRRSSAVWPD